MRRSFLLFDSENIPTQSFAQFMREVQVPGKNLLEIDDALQARFFQKNPDGSPKERWELSEIPSLDKKALMRHLTNCGFVNLTLPNSKTYDYAAWPGALITRASIRLGELFVAWNHGIRWKKLVVFGSKRPLNPEKESFYACCNAICLPLVMLQIARKNWREINPQTELDMMRWIWSITKIAVFLENLDVVFVDAPMKPPFEEGEPLVRPTTEDTILEWLKSSPNPGSVLLSSGAPYGMAQDEAFWMLLEPYGFTVETFGHAALDLPIENFMREVAGCVNRIRRARGS